MSNAGLPVREAASRALSLPLQSSTDEAEVLNDPELQEQLQLVSACGRTISVQAAAFGARAANGAQRRRQGGRWHTLESGCKRQLLGRTGPAQLEGGLGRTVWWGCVSLLGAH